MQLSIQNQPAIRPPRKAVQARETMYNLFGRCEFRHCALCKHLTTTNGYAPKCTLSGLKGNSTDTDWNKNWTACGKFKFKYSS